MVAIAATDWAEVAQSITTHTAALVVVRHGQSFVYRDRVAQTVAYMAMNRSGSAADVAEILGLHLVPREGREGTEWETLCAIADEVMDEIKLQS